MSAYNSSPATSRKTLSVRNSGGSSDLNLNSVSPYPATTPPKVKQQSPSDTNNNNGSNSVVETTFEAGGEHSDPTTNQEGGEGNASQVPFSADGNNGNGYHHYRYGSSGGYNNNLYFNHHHSPYHHHHLPSSTNLGYSPMSQASSGGGVFNQSNGGGSSSPFCRRLQSSPSSSPVYGYWGRQEAQRYSSGYGSPTTDGGSFGGIINNNGGVGKKPTIKMKHGAADYGNAGVPDVDSFFNRLNLNSGNANGGNGGGSMKEHGIVNGNDACLSVGGSPTKNENDGGTDSLVGSIDGRSPPKSDVYNMGGPLAIGGGIPVLRNGCYNPYTTPTLDHPPIGLPPLPSLHHGGYRSSTFSNVDPALMQQKPWATESLHQAGINPYVFYNLVSDSHMFDRYARFFRNATENIHPSYMMQGPSRTWSGPLPTRNYNNPMYSCKIFIGGVPWDVSEGALLSCFTEFGTCQVEWPGKEARYNCSPVKATPRGRGNGYVYIIYEQEKFVRALLEECSQEYGCGGDWYYKLNAKRSRTKEIRQVQVIPWVIGDSNYVLSATARLDPKKTVFIGALHGMVTAEILAKIMNDLFDNVVYAGVDTDKFKYPIGSGRVTFSTSGSYYAAINSAFVEIKTTKFKKKVQIDPFLEDEICSVCNKVPGPYFCRQTVCFKYFCRVCWQANSICTCSRRPEQIDSIQKADYKNKVIISTAPKSKNTHSNLKVFRHHKPLMRNSRRIIDSSEAEDKGQDRQENAEHFGGSPVSTTDHGCILHARRRLIDNPPSPNVPGRSNGSNGGHEGDVDTVESQRSFLSNNSASPVHI